MARPELLGGVFYINLDRRTDRKSELEGELSKMGIIGAQRISGIPTDPGYLGCGLAHEAAVKAGRGLKNVLIFEDDFQFLVEPEEFWASLEQAMKEPYDVIMLGCNLRESEEWPSNDSLVRVIYGATGSGYLINGHMIDQIAALFEDANKKLAVTHQHWLYANDACWRSLQQTGCWLTFKKRIGKQRASYSDNNKMFIDRPDC